MTDAPRRNPDGAPRPNSDGASRQNLDAASRQNSVGAPRQAPAPWQVLGSRTLHRDRWLDVRADRCVTATGAELDPYYVLRYRDWANVVALTGDGRVVTIHQYRHGVGETVLELPGGMVDTAEDPAQAAGRELTEETGYVAAALHHVCSYPANPATHTNRIHTYLAQEVGPVGRDAREAGEDLVVELMPVAALLAALRDSRFGQAMQAGPILLALEAAGRLRIDAAS